MTDTTDAGQATATNVQQAEDDSRPSHGVAEDGRVTWSGRVTFWLAAVGSAVGLGNLWRFPWQCAKWGAGAFIIAYFIALFTLGMPILTQELALGQKHRSGDIEAFGKMNWRLRGVGLASVIGAFGIVSYYMMIIGLSTVYFFESFMVPLPWDEDDVGTASEYWTTILKLSSDITDSGHHDGGIFSWKVWGATMLCWVITFICIRRGVKTASWAVKITMPLPFLLLFILLVKAVTLPGAGDGISRYMDFSNFEELSDSPLWIAAIGQCFFSLSVCMGVMTAFGSYNPISQDVATDEKVISFLDVGASLMSGFVVYCILGFLSHEDPDTDWYALGGPGLVFGAFPVAIAQFKGANFFAIIFYLTLMLLGIDSAFSMVEAVSTVIDDSDFNKYKLQWSRMKISTVICVAGALCSCMYCFDTGFYWLDLVDFYINNYGMVFLGICETGACGWFYSYELIDAKIGKTSSDMYRYGYWTSVLVGSILAFSLSQPEGNEGSVTFTAGMGGDSWIVGFIVSLVGWAITCYLAWYFRSEEAKKLGTGELWWYIMGWENVEVLRGFMNSNGIGKDRWDSNKHTLNGEALMGVHHSTIGIWWGFLIKYWAPTLLTVVLLSEFREKSYNPYEGYPWGYLMVGVIWFSLMVIVVALIAVFPEWMTQKGDPNGVPDPEMDHGPVKSTSVELDQKIELGTPVGQAGAGKQTEGTDEVTSE